jgi:hypothetical protein
VPPRWLTCSDIRSITLFEGRFLSGHFLILITAFRATQSRSVNALPIRFGRPIALAALLRGVLTLIQGISRNRSLRISIVGLARVLHLRL